MRVFLAFSISRSFPKSRPFSETTTEMKLSSWDWSWAVAKSEKMERNRRKGRRVAMIFGDKPRRKLRTRGLEEKGGGRGRVIMSKMTRRLKEAGTIGGA